MTEDYTQAALSYKVRKVIRYARLFGAGATAAKVRSQYHMRGAEVDRNEGTMENPRCRDGDSPARRVAIIGAGKFAYSVIARYLEKEESRFLRATLDLDLGRAVSLTRRFGGAYATTDLGAILGDDQVDLVYVASNHATHAEYAIECIRAGKAVHVEKPHAVTRDQVLRFDEAMAGSPETPVFLGFNRPKSSHFRKVQAALRDEEGPLSASWFIAGHQIDEGHWYFSEKEGGRVLGNLCHWLDASIHLVGANFWPVELVPTSPPESQSDFTLTARCGDGSSVTFVFSAKGHTFEGVREVLNLQKGSTLVLLRDFHETRIGKGRRTTVSRTRIRDHGHRANVLNSWRQSTTGSGEARDYVLGTGLLAVAAADALSSGEVVVVQRPQGGPAIPRFRKHGD